MIKRSLEQLSQETDLILLGTVISQVSAWNDQHTAIHTDVTVAVEEAMKGSPGTEVTFRVAGGIVGDIGMRTSHSPVFQDGEQVIVFLNTAVVPARAWLARGNIRYRTAPSSEMDTGSRLRALPMLSALPPNKRGGRPQERELQ